MKRGLSSILSIVIGQRSIALAQLSLGKAGTSVHRVGQFDPGAKDWLDRPAEAGRALQAFLTAHQFDANAAVVGIPARWLLAQAKDLPPTDDAAAAAILRLAAERLSLAGSAPLIADFASGPAASRAVASRVLLVGMLRGQFEKVIAFAEAAGLSLQAVCPTSLGILASLAGDESMLLLDGDEAELVTQDGGVPTMIRPMAAAPQQLTGELKRTFTMRPGSGNLLLAGGNLNAADRSALALRIGPGARVVADDLPHVGFDASAFNGSAGGMSRTAALPAVALGAAALAGRLPVDFAASKLAEAPPRRFGRRTVYGVGLALASILALAAFEWHIESREAESGDLQKKVEGITPQLKLAKAAVDRFTFGRPYFAAHPPQLDCLKQLTMAFNYDEPIWASNVQLRDSGSGQLQGKAANRSLAFALIDRVKGQAALSNVQMGEVREGAGREKETSYTIGFTYSPAAPAAKPADAGGLK